MDAMGSTTFYVPTSSVVSKTLTSAIPVPTSVPDKPTIQSAGDTGHRTLWTVFVLMLISTIIFAALAFRVPVQKRLFHIITTFITATAAISYYAMATGDGNSYSKNIKRKPVEVVTSVPHIIEEIWRQIFYARYIDWAITTPLLLLDLAFLAGMSGANIIVALFADVVMILCGLFAAFGREGGQKWGYYAMACVAYLIIVYLLAVSGRAAADTRDAKTSAFYKSLGFFTIAVWTAYPIIWGIGDGARHMSVDAEIIAYAILDILAKIVFGFWLLITHEQVASTNIHLDGAWTHGFGKREGSLRVGDDDEGA
ncbi:MAG: hypothetical protein M1816_004389 [Peltula sp. TS41687]|nr:MAG: hypothetical protein M1816_004389 [Peltula sp. TS41687]